MFIKKNKKSVYFIILDSLPVLYRYNSTITNNIPIIATITLNVPPSINSRTAQINMIMSVTNHT